MGGHERRGQLGGNPEGQKAVWGGTVMGGRSERDNFGGAVGEGRL